MVGCRLSDSTTRKPS